MRVSNQKEEKKRAFLLNFCAVLLALIMFSQQIPASPRPVLLPDLVVQSITYSPRNPSTNDLIEITAVVKNNGRAPSSGYWGFSIKIGDEPDPISYYIPPLDPGSKVEFTRRTSLRTPGNYPVRGTIKPSRQGESSLLNNSRITYINIPDPDPSPYPVPDLIIDQFHCPDRSRRTWRTFKFYVTVKNIGYERAPSSILQVKFQRSRWPGIAMGYLYETKTFTIPELLQGQTHRIKTTRKWSRRGYREVIAIVDPARRIPEISDNNNSKSMRIRVK